MTHVKITLGHLLSATRGPHAESKYDLPALDGIVGIVEEQIAAQAGGLGPVTLSQPFSAGFDVITAAIDDGSHIVLDQSFLELSCRLNELVIPLVMGGLEDPAPRAVGTGLATIIAARRAVEGRLSEALALAAMPAEPRGPRRSDLVWRRASQWSVIQSCFAVAHELGHCRTLNGSPVSRSTAAQFEDEMRHAATFYDTNEQHSLTNPFLDNLDEIRERSDSPDEFARLLKGFQEAQGFRRDLSRLELIDYVIDESQWLGEEVLSDYMAYRVVDGIQDAFGLPADEVLLAAYSGMSHQILLANIGSQLKAGGEWAEPMPRFVRRIEEAQTRLWFGKMCVCGLSNSNQREWEQSQEGSPPAHVLRRIAEERIGRLYSRMRDLDAEWIAEIRRAAMDAGPLCQLAEEMGPGFAAQLGTDERLVWLVANTLGTQLHPDIAPASSTVSQPPLF